MSKIEQLAASFAIAVGLSMLSWWLFFLSTNQMPELEITPIAAWLHLAAELTTALVLLASGIGLLTNRWWAGQAVYVSLGMLLYAVIQAAGYFAQLGQTAMVLVFTGLFLLALLLLANRIKLDRAGG